MGRKHPKKAKKAVRPSGAAKAGKRKQAAAGRGARRERGPVVEGRVSLHRRGFGFVVDREGREQDVFLSPGELSGIMDGDEVRVEVERGRDGRLSGRLLSILARAHRKVVGIFQRGPHGSEVIPDGATFRQRLLVEADRKGGRRPHGARHGRGPVRAAAGAGEAPRAHPGEVVEVEILEYPSRFRPGRARLIFLLGYVGYSFV
jgi:exoribonuclease R